MKIVSFEARAKVLGKEREISYKKQSYFAIYDLSPDEAQQLVDMLEKEEPSAGVSLPQALTYFQDVLDKNMEESSTCVENLKNLPSVAAHIEPSVTTHTCVCGDTFSSDDGLVHHGAICEVARKLVNGPLKEEFLVKGPTTPQHVVAEKTLTTPIIPATTSSDSPAAQPRRRGRPPKVKTEAQEATPVLQKAEPSKEVNIEKEPNPAATQPPAAFALTSPTVEDVLNAHKEGDEDEESAEELAYAREERLAIQEEPRIGVFPPIEEHPVFVPPTKEEAKFDSALAKVMTVREAVKLFTERGMYDAKVIEVAILDAKSWAPVDTYLAKISPQDLPQRIQAALLVYPPPKK